MSFVLLGILNSQVEGGWTPGPYFIGTYGDANIVSGVGDIALDSSNNLYTGARTYPGVGGYLAAVFSWTGTGTPRWIKRFGSGNNDLTGVVCDSSDNVITTGYTGLSATGGSTSFVNKFNSTGTSQWSYELESSGEDEGEGIGVDSSGNTYTTGWSSFGTGRKAIIHKRNSSGTIQWQRQFGDSGVNQFGSGIVSDSSGNSYVCGYITPSNIDAFLIKYNSSGTIQWQQKLGGGGTDDFLNVTLDSSGNVYAVGYTTSEGAGSTNGLIAKYNSSGALLWQRVMGTASVTTQFFGVNCDSSGNVFAVGRTNAGSNGLIAKFDSSGTLLFQREITGYSQIQDVVVDSNDDIYCSFITNNAGAGNYDNGIMYLPGDGSRMSTVTVDGYDFTYQEASTTLITSTLTDASAGQSESSSSLTDASIGFSYASPSWTQYLTLV